MDQRTYEKKQNYISVTCLTSNTSTTFSRSRNIINALMRSRGKTSAESLHGQQLI